MSDWNTPPPPPPPGAPGGPPNSPAFGPPPSGPSVGGPAQPGGSNQPLAPIEPSPRKRRSTGKVAALVAVVAIVAAGAFAVTRFAGGESEPAGAASPEALGDGVLAAFESSDAIAAAELLVPGERDAISDPAFDVIDELERLEVLSDVDLEQVNGIDVTLDDENVEIEQTNVDDIVLINLTAQATVEVDASELPIGEVIEERADESQLEDSTTTEPFEAQVVGIEQDGEWYLSLLYTAADAIRQSDLEDDTGEVPGIPEVADAVAPKGADSPEGAIENMLAAFEDKDLEAIIAGLDPTEASALQRYSPLFLDDAQAEFDDPSYEIRVKELDPRVEGSGSQREVFIDAVAFEFDENGETAYVQYSDGCITVEANDEKDEVCFTGEGIEAELDNALNDLDDPKPVKEFIDAFKDAFSDFEVPGIVVTEHDGEWFVSPIKTFDEGLLSVLEALDSDELKELIDKGEDALNSFLLGSFDPDD